MQKVRSSAIPSGATRSGRIVQRLVGGLGFCLLASGCDAPRTTEPAVPAVEPLVSSATDGYDAGTTILVPLSPNGDPLPFTEVATLEEGEVALVRLEGHYTVSLTQEFRSAYCFSGPSSPYSHICGAWEPYNWTVKVPYWGGIPGPSGGHDSALGTAWRFRGPNGTQYWSPVVGPGSILVRHHGVPGVFNDGIRWYDVQSGVRVRIRRKGKPKLVLECNGSRGSVSVERGSTIDCTAKTEPEGAALEVTKWTFEGEGSTIKGPAGSMTWGGTMVVGGSITVKGTVRGEPDEASIGVVIQPRDWAGKTSFPPMPEPAKSSEFDYPPVGTAGRGVGDGVFGKHTYDVVTPGGNLGLGSGANANWWYLKEPPRIENARIHVNPGLYPDDPFFRAQTGGPYCDRSFMHSARSFVERHEKRHHEIAAEFYNGPAAQRYEAAVFYQPKMSGPLDELLDSLYAATEKALKAKQAAFDESSKLALPCDLNTIPGPGR